MVVADQSIYIHHTPTHLLPVNVADQRLPVAFVFLAHAASLLLFVQFSRTNLDGFLHSFNSARMRRPTSRNHPMVSHRPGCGVMRKLDEITAWHPCRRVAAREDGFPPGSNRGPIRGRETVLSTPRKWRDTPAVRE